MHVIPVLQICVFHGIAFLMKRDCRLLWKNRQGSEKSTIPRTVLYLRSSYSLHGQVCDVWGEAVVQQ